MAIATNFARILLAGAALLAGSQAMAAEPFNGPYIGAEAGWQQDKLEASVDTAGVVLSTAEDSSSVGYGAQIGYDFKLAPSFVIGAEAFVGGDTGKIRADGASADAGRTFGLAARAGVLATPQTLVYAKGGWVNGRFSFDDGVDRASQNRDGWTLGGGIEQMLGDSLSARVEYRYAKFNRFEGDVADFGGDDVSARFERHQVMAGVNLRF